jgi:hypothetical protein
MPRDFYHLAYQLPSGARVTVQPPDEKAAWAGFRAALEPRTGAVDVVLRRNGEVVAELREGTLFLAPDEEAPSDG